MRRWGQRHEKKQEELVWACVCGCISSNSLSSSSRLFRPHFGCKHFKMFDLERFYHNNVTGVEIEDKPLVLEDEDAQLSPTSWELLSTQKNCFLFPYHECMPLQSFLLFSHLSDRNLAIQTMSCQILSISRWFYCCSDPRTVVLSYRGDLVMIIVSIRFKASWSEAATFHRSYVMMFCVALELIWNKGGTDWLFASAPAASLLSSNRCVTKNVLWKMVRLF